MSDYYKIKNKLANISNLEVGTPVQTAGRILKIRDMGRIAFGNLVDFYGEIQLFFNEKTVEKKAIFKEMGNGDFIGVKGTVTKTKADKIAIEVESVDILTKVQIRPHEKRGQGFQDEEATRRLRYIDYIYNPEVREMLAKRHKIIKTIKDYLNNDNFIEVETPYLQTIASGASATPFKTDYNALGIPLFLRIAPELFLKRLIISGLNKVYEIGKCFRNEGIDPTHLPEFTMLEWYEAYVSHEEGQNRVIELLQKVFKAVNNEQLSNQYYDFSHIPKIEYIDFLEQSGLPRDIWSMSYDDIVSIAKNKSVEYKDCKNKSAIIDRLYKKCGIHKIQNPVLIYNYPNKPLAIQIPDRKGFSYSFQVVIGGKECVNAYMEQRDPQALLAEFEDQKSIEASGDDEFVRQDLEFVEGLKHGMPPTVGVGIGIDRLCAILTNTENLRDVISFPLNKNIVK